MTDTRLPRPSPIPRISAEEARSRTLDAASPPVVIEGALAGWPIVSASCTPEELLDKLASKVTAPMVKVSDLPPSFRRRLGYRGPDDPRPNFEKVELPFAEFAAALLAELARPTERSLYLQAAPLDLFAGLGDELPCPIIGRDVPGRIWIGNGQRVPTHHDQPNNLACVVAGEKRATLFPPDQISNLYVGPVERAWTAAGLPESRVEHTSPELARFPRYEAALAHAQQADLRPGDVLFIPSFWWHHMDSTGFNVLVNFWWDDRDALPAAHAAFLHALLSFRDQPDADRARWKILFDYFVFRATGDAYEGLPKDVRAREADTTLAELRAQLVDLLRKTKVI